MTRDHHVTIHGMPWLLRFTKLRGNAAGWCYMPEPRNPKKKAYKILIDSRMPDGSRDQLETIIHEVMHASYPTVEESHITESARDMARILWDLGYRLSID